MIQLAKPRHDITPSQRDTYMSCFHSNLFPATFLQLYISFISDFIQMLQVGANRMSINSVLNTETIPIEQGKLLNQCSCCHKVYSTRSALFRHIRYECGVERRFKCHICYRLFRHKHHLRYHLNSHVKYNEGQIVPWEDKLLRPL